MYTNKLTQFKTAKEIAKESNQKPDTSDQSERCVNGYFTCSGLFEALEQCEECQQIETFLGGSR